MSRTFDSLRFPNYRKWFAGALVANTGTWMQRIAQTWLVLTVLTAQSATAVGIVVALQFAPIMLLTVWAGVLADRVDRRKLLLFTQSALGLTSALLGALVLTGAVVLWHVYVFALVLGVLSALDGPVRLTFVSELVPASSLSNAVGLNGASFNFARLIGPAVAGFMTAAVGTGWVFLLVGVAFLGPVLALLAMRPADLYAQTHAKRGKGAMRDGIAYVRSRGDILVIMGVMAVVGAFGLNFQITSSVMAREVFERGAGEFGILNTLMGIGALAGALLAARRQRPRVRLVVGSAFAFGVFMVASAFSPSFLVFALSGIPVGFFSTTMMNSANAAIQLASPPEVRGRVMSFYMLVFMGTTPIASPFVGWIAEQFGARTMVVVGGAACVLAAICAALYARRTWAVEVHYHFATRPHVEVLGPSERAAATL